VVSSAAKSAKALNPSESVKHEAFPDKARTCGVNDFDADE
jgi:hypothetical protein